MEYIDGIVTRWCTENPPSKNEGFAGLSKRKTRHRGDKAVKATASNVA